MQPHETLGRPGLTLKAGQSANLAVPQSADRYVVVASATPRLYEVSITGIHCLPQFREALCNVPRRKLPLQEEAIVDPISRQIRPFVP